MDPSLDRAVRRGAIVITVILLAIVSLTSAVLLNPSWRDRARRQLGWTTQFTVGSASGLPPEWYQDAKPTVVIFVSGTCPACAQAAPFHRALRAASASAGLKALTALTALNDDPSAYAARESVADGDVVKFDFRGSPLRLVPTIVVVDHRGVVVEMKEGVLPEAEQHALMARLWSLR